MVGILMLYLTTPQFCNQVNCIFHLHKTNRKVHADAKTFFLANCYTFV